MTQRPIKFRAWDGEKMFYQSENTVSAMEGLSFFAEKAGAVKGMTPPIMQFTGLLDKNGKEIYEGDVVRGLFGEQQKEPLEEIRGSVDFSRGSFGINFPARYCRLHDLDGNNAIYWCDEQGITGLKWFYRIEGLEVIGNIYENPELLK